MVFELQLTPFPAVTCSLLIGVATGALISGSLAGHPDCRKIILIPAVIFALYALGASLAPTLEIMLFSRGVPGLQEERTTLKCVITEVRS